MRDEVTWYRDAAQLQRLLAQESVIEAARLHHEANARHYDSLADRLQAPAGPPAAGEHWSDCAVHNAPALPVGACDCEQEPKAPDA